MKTYHCPFCPQVERKPQLVLLHMASYHPDKVVCFIDKPVDQTNHIIVEGFLTLRMADRIDAKRFLHPV